MHIKQSRWIVKETIGEMATAHDTGRMAYGYAGLTVAIWSGFILVSRLGGVSPLTPFDMTALRFGTGALVLLPIYFMRRPVALLDRRMLVLALIGGIGYALLVYGGFKLAPAAHAAVLLPGILPFEIALLSWLMLGEPLSRRRQQGLALIAAGVGCLAMESLKEGMATWRGDVLLVASSCSWALYTVLAGRWAVTAWAATTGVALLAAAIYLPIYVLFLPKALSAVSWMAIGMQAFYQGILAVIVAMLLYMKAIAALGPQRMGTLMALVPAVSGYAASVLLHEQLSVWSLAGILFVSAGAFISNRKPRLTLDGGKPCLT